jgi:competence protein ComEA
MEGRSPGAAPGRLPPSGHDETRDGRLAPSRNHAILPFATVAQPRFRCEDTTDTEEDMHNAQGSKGRGQDYAIVVIAVAIAAILALVYVRARDNHHDAPPIIVSGPATPAAIVVSVDGAVTRPGAYDLPGGARVRDAIAAAGGPSAAADLRNVNLAHRLRDEEKVVVPSRVAEPTRAPASSGTRAPVSAVAVNINTATASQLEALPSIGPVLAGRIIAYREEHGPFQSVDDLAKVDGISRRIVEQLRPLVTVGQ